MKALKQILLLALLCVHVFAIASDEQRLIYLNDRMEVVKSKKQAHYIAELVKESNGTFTFVVKYLTGETKMEGTYLDRDMMVAHGEFTYYYRSGQVESAGLFRDGYKYGIWQRYDESGTEKAERIYATGPMMKNIMADTNK